MNPKVIVFADLDGTILDENYSFAEVQPIIRQLVTLEVAVVFNSSKTKAEVEYYKRKLRLSEPYIVENGSAIITPKGYFRSKFPSTKQSQFSNTIQLGVGYAEIRKKLADIQKKTNAKLIGFGDMSPREIAQDAKLPIELARLSKEREYDEPFRIIEGSETSVIQAIKEAGLSYTKGGRYFHLLGDTDKGRALATLRDLYLKEYLKIVTIGVGDGLNDLPMLNRVNKPFLIDSKKPRLKVWKKVLEAAQACKTNQ